MAPAYPKKAPLKPSVQMRQLHWGKIADAKIKGTMWDGEVSDEHVKVDTTELEQMFAAVAASKGSDGEKGGAAKKAESKKAEVVTLVDAKTSNNTAIALSRFTMKPEAIAAALLAGDGQSLTESSLSSLQAILPSAEEVELVQGFQGPKEQLGKAETFFLAIASVPRYTMRVKTMLVRAQWPERIHELRSKIEDVGSAVKEVRGSKALRSVIEHALAYGNYLNGGTNKGAAWGFKLDGLNKLAGTKSLDGKSTLLHYMARKLAAKGMVDALADELEHVENAARVVWKDEEGELNAITAALKQVETQVKLDKNESFTSSMGAFASGAKAELEKVSEAKKGADKACVAMVKWLGEDAKMQPEDVFSTLHSFCLTLEKGHRNNLENEEKEAKRVRMEAAAQKQKAEIARRKTVTAGGDSEAVAKELRAPGKQPFGGGKPPPFPGGKPPVAGLAVDSELAAKLARRNDRGKTDLVDGVARGMANGIRVRQLSFDRRAAGKGKAPPPGAAKR